VPEKFKHSQSCYVVDVLHWIQCRYLLVKPIDKDATMLDSTQTRVKHRHPWEVFEQDPQYEITGASNNKGKSRPDLSPK
jgi:hypothetical protein